MQEPRPRTKGGEMKRTLFLLSSTLLASNTWAQRVYKCRNGSETIHQSLPCTAEQETGVSRRVVNDPVLTASEQRRNQQMLRDARARMQIEAGRGQNIARQGSVISAAADPERCDTARMRHEMAEIFARGNIDELARQAELACRP